MRSQSTAVTVDLRSRRPRPFPARYALLSYNMGAAPMQLQRHERGTHVVRPRPGVVPQWLEGFLRPCSLRLRVRLARDTQKPPQAPTPQKPRCGTRGGAPQDTAGCCGRDANGS